MTNSGESAADRLRAANQEARERRRIEDEAQAAAQDEAQRRSELFETAQASFQGISRALLDAIREAAPETSASWPLRLSDAELNLAPIQAVSASQERGGRYPIPFSVIAVTEINLRIPRDHWNYEGCSHSLWFCDAKEKGVNRWHETAFMFSPLIQRSSSQEPFALEPGDESGVALSNVTGEFQAAWPFTPIDLGEEGGFIERWVGWFADAAQGKLQHPSHMPERDPKGSWRQS